jgi:hypothetical protein
MQNKLTPYGHRDEKLAALAGKVMHRFDEYDKNRRATELRWMRNLRQYLGQYDPEVLKRIPAGRSKVYPRDTFVKVTGLVAKMMELLFPANEKNWGITPSPVPNLRQDVVDQIIEDLIVQFEQQQRKVSSDDIEAAVFSYAEDRARAMEKECSDQLTEMKYVMMAMRVIRSGVIYGMGVAKGPLVKVQNERIWQYNPEIQRYAAVTLDRAKPYFEFVPVWNIYPDLDARDWCSQEGLFERMVFNRNELYHMLEDESFMGDVLETFLCDHPRGNYVRRSFESEIDEVRGTLGGGERHNRMYEVIKYYGFWPSEEIRGLDRTLSKDDVDKHKDLLVECWLIGGKIFRLNKAVLGEKPSDFYHAFIYRDDEEVSMVGAGLPEAIRDSQLSHCAIRRMLIDNASTTAGPMFEVNTELLEPSDTDDNIQIHAFKVFRRVGMGDSAAHQAVRDIQIESHIPELLRLSEDIQQRLDIESNMPAWMYGGQPQNLGEAFRTSTNMSMMMGTATMGMKAVVRSYDMFTESLIGSLVEWNMEFNERDEVKGDFQVVTRGSTSLVAKELRGIALDQFIATLTDTERKLLKTREVLIDRLQARDLPVDRVVDVDRANEILAQEERAAAQMAETMAAAEGAKMRKLESAANLDDTKAQVMLSDAGIKKQDADTRRIDAATRAAATEGQIDRNIDQTELESIDRILELSRFQQEGRQNAVNTANDVARL